MSRAKSKSKDSGGFLLLLTGRIMKHVKAQFGRFKPNTAIFGDPRFIQSERLFFVSQIVLNQESIFRLTFSQSIILYIHFIDSYRIILNRQNTFFFRIFRPKFEFSIFYPNKTA